MNTISRSPDLIGFNNILIKIQKMTTEIYNWRRARDASSQNPRLGSCQVYSAEPHFLATKYKFVRRARFSIVQINR